jgi:hypothetical protein
LLVRYLLLLGGYDPQHPLGREVAKQDAHHPKREVDLRGKVHDGHRATADAENPTVLRPRPEMLMGSLAGGNHNVYQAE